MTMRIQEVKPHIRWMVRRDITEGVLDIERESFEDDTAWREEDFLRCLRQKLCIGMVAEENSGGDDPKIVGFMIYELCKHSLHILNFAVHPMHRRVGIGRCMAEKLCFKLKSHRRSRVILETRESNLDAQLFFRSQCFEAIRVERGYYEDTGEDAFVFCYRAQPE
jgi:ribosomal-protein-alanine N-acetyltransferase